MAARFVAGETLADALRVAGELNASGLNVTLDHLGEHTTTLAEAAQATEAILSLLNTLDTNWCAYISIKLAQIRLALEETLYEHNLECILARACQSKTFVRGHGRFALRGLDAAFISSYACHRF